MARVAIVKLALLSSAAASSLYDMSAVDIDGKSISLNFAGNVTVVMNTATLCGFTASNYAAMTKLQSKYAEKPVNFLLVPCNQFGSQEPAANEDIKKFAEKSVHLGGGSNVIMLAKSNLNNVKCPCDGEECCTPSSKACCPKNDGVYDYLLASTAPHTIGWNFDKIITGPDGKPYSGEKILDGNAVEPQLSEVIDELLAKKAATEMRELSFSTGIVAVTWLAAASTAAFLVAYRMLRWWQRRATDTPDAYVNMVA